MYNSTKIELRRCPHLEFCGTAGQGSSSKILPATITVIQDLDIEQIYRTQSQATELFTPCQWKAAKYKYFDYHNLQIRMLGHCSSTRVQPSMT